MPENSTFRFLYVTDLHGWIDGYEQISQIAQEEEITVVINGGDMLPHAKDLIFTQRLFIEEYLLFACPLQITLFSEMDS